MKFLRCFSKITFFISLIIITIIFSTLYYLDYNIGDNFKLKKGENLKFNTVVPVTAEYDGIALSQSKIKNSVGNEFKVDLKLFGIIPFSTVDVQIVDELYVVALGEPFGMKLYTEGVLVVELTKVETKNGNINPAESAGIKKGDYILSVNGKQINTNEDLSNLVEKSNGSQMEFLIKRKNKKLKIKIKPVLSKDTNTYKIGIWIKDSSAGIGMLTFYSPSLNVVSGLGHGICDEDTGTLYNTQSGEVISAEIIGVEKGAKGSPGQLKGRLGNRKIGDIDKNSYLGVFSILDGKITHKNLIEIALKQEIKNGKAKILCTVNGNTPEFYDCEIEVRTSSFYSKSQNMIVTVTDEKLLNSTGGIVQGMSGSPLIQNGKLIGAVTHVLVNDPTRGYGIFIENMLETANQVAEEQAKKDAS